MQVTPALAPVKFAARAQQSLGAQSFVEPVRWTASVAEEKHRADALVEKPPRDVGNQ